MRRTLWSGLFSAQPGGSTLARSSINSTKENHESTNPCQPHSIYGRFREEIEGFDSLVELALDMRCSWNHSTDEVWGQLDPKL